jgi:ketosteroid isomerase-like protein
VVGKEQLRAFFEPGFEQFDYYIGDSEGLVVQVAGDWAYSHGNYTMTITPKEGGPTTYFDGKWLDVLKKQADGSWKVYCDSATDNVPPKVE